MKQHCRLLVTLLGWSICLAGAASVQDGDIIFGKGNSLVYLDISTRRKWDLFASNSSPFSIDYLEQPDGYSVFWCDLNHNAVYSGQLKNKTLINPRAIMKDNVAYVETIAVDWIAQHLYWVAKNLGQIQVSRLDGSYRAPVVVDIVEPRALALDPVSGWMFWSDLNRDLPSIEKSTMAGEQRNTLFQIHTTKQNGWLNAIAIDHSNQKLYWVDARSDSIHSISYDGSNYQEMVKGHSSMKHPISIVVSNGNIIWSDAQERAIVQINPNNNISEKLHQTNHGIFGITVLHSSRKPEGKNPCSTNNGGCSHLCLINGLGFKCHCPISMRLLPDNKTCQGDDTVFLITYKDTSNSKKIQEMIISRLVFDALDSTLSSFPVEKISSISSIDFDASENRVWTSSSLNGLRGTSLSNSSNEHYFETAVFHADNVAWNWLTSEVYAIAHDLNSGIFRCSLQQNTCVKVINQEMDFSSSLTVLPVHGVMFWLNKRNGHSIIEGSSLTGIHRTTVVIGQELLCLTSDLNGNLYWIDWTDKSVKRMRPSSTIDTIWHFSVGMEQPVSMGVSNEMLFFCTSKNILYVINFTSNRSSRYTVPNVDEMLQIKIVNVTHQKGIINDCLKNTISCPGRCYNKQTNQMDCQSWDLETSPLSKTLPSTMKSSSLRKELIGPQLNNSKIKEEISCNLTCLNNGKCVFTSTGNQLCYCPVLYWGERCEMNLCPCRHGECKISRNEMTCICHKGFSGHFCDQPICNKFCQNGNCSYKNGLPRCICEEGWSGPDCSFHSTKVALTDDCGNYCLNGGSCISNTDGQSTLKCMCPPHFTGMRCQFSQSSRVDENINLLGSSLWAFTIVICFGLLVILIIASSLIYCRYRRLRKKMSKAHQCKECLSSSDSSLLLTRTNNNTSLENGNSCLQILKKALNCSQDRSHNFSTDTQPLQQSAV